MNLEDAKEMDRKCVLNWLNEVYITPSLSYSGYTDEEIRTLAHDAIVLLKAQPEIVRCKECRHKGNPYECRLDRDLEEHGSHRTYEWDDWYCADGKPKESEHENH